MKSSNILIGMVLGMGAGAWLYSYLEGCPINLDKTKNKVEKLIKDLK